jgi:SAM-dependent methyltransferase
MNGVRANDYDAIAEAYAEKVEANVWNAHYERVNALRLVGEVSGKRVLDAGCGSGAHAIELANRGATVTGVDASAALLAIAARRPGGRMTLVRADLTAPLPFADQAFDVVLSSLVMHYLHDWVPTLTEFRRVLTSRGRLVISTHHPTVSHALGGGDDYLATYALDDEWEVGDQLARFRYWHRPLSAISQALSDSGFVIERMEEPYPDEVVREIDPEEWRKLTTQPAFLFLVARPR